MGGILARARRRCRLGACQSDGVRASQCRGGAATRTRPPCARVYAPGRRRCRRPRPGPRWSRSAAGSPTSRPPGCPSPTRWCSPRSRPTAYAGGPHGAAQGVRRARPARSSPTRARAKAAELAANPRAALVFPWHALGAAGAGHRPGRRARPRRGRRRTSRPGRGTRSWAPGPARSRRWSASRAELDARWRRSTARFPGPRCRLPPGWGGYPGGARGLGVLGRPERAAARPAALPAYRTGRADRAPGAIERLAPLNRARTGSDPRA